MKVFICWSGGLSKAIARELRDWLPEVIQSVEPFFSDEDIAAGTTWFSKIDEQINDTYFGILCMTATNKRSHWMHYEAGGLRKGIGENSIVPLRIDIDGADLEQPIANFQHTACDKEGVKRLLDSINEASGESKLTDSRLQRAFENHWQAFEDTVERHKETLVTDEEAEPERTADDKIDEMLSLLRLMNKSTDVTIRPFDLPLVLDKKSYFNKLNTPSLFENFYKALAHKQQEALDSALSDQVASKSAPAKKSIQEPEDSE